MKEIFLLSCQKSTSTRAQAREAIPSLLTEEEDEALIAPFTEMEIEEAVRSMPSDKTPGPDSLPANFTRGIVGFSGGCYACRIISDNVLMAQGVFHSTGNAQKEGRMVGAKLDMERERELIV